MKIYQTENKFIEVIEDDNSHLFMELMSEDFFCLKFSSDKMLSIPLNSYIKVDFYGKERLYWMLSEPDFTKVNSTNYEYTVNFYNGIQILKNTLCVDLRLSNIEQNVFLCQPSFYMYGKPIDFLQLIIDNLNYRGNSQYDWMIYSENFMISPVLDAPAKTLYFNCFNCFEALQYVAEEFKCEWNIYYRGRKADIKLKRIEENKGNPLNLSYGYDSGVKEGVRVQCDESGSFNVLWVKGGSRNINAQTYRNRTLLLPKSQIISYEGKRYVTDKTGNFILQEHPQNKFSFETVIKYAGQITGKEDPSYSHELGVDICVLSDENIPDNYDFNTSKIGDFLRFKIISGQFAGQIFLCNYKHDEGKYIFQEVNIFSIHPNIEIGTKYELSGFKIQLPKFKFPKLVKDSVIDLSHIYPSRESKITMVIKEDDGWYFYDSSIPEELNYEKLLIEVETLKVIFQSGLLAGKEFEVNYKHWHDDSIQNDGVNDWNKLRRFKIIEATIDELIYPNDYFYPKEGDSFIVFGMQMPQEYICDYGNKSGASFDMLNEAARHFHENHNEKIEVKFDIDSDFFKKHYDKIAPKILLGGYISIPDVVIAEIPIRIKSVKYNLTDKHSPVIELYTNNKKASNYALGNIYLEANDAQQGEAVQKVKNITETKFNIVSKDMDMIDSRLRNIERIVLI